MKISIQENVVFCATARKAPLVGVAVSTNRVKVAAAKPFCVAEFENLLESAKWIAEPAEGKVLIFQKSWENFSVLSGERTKDFLYGNFVSYDVNIRFVHIRYKRVGKRSFPMESFVLLFQK